MKIFKTANVSETVQNPMIYKIFKKFLNYGNISWISSEAWDKRSGINTSTNQRTQYWTARWNGYIRQGDEATSNIYAYALTVQIYLDQENQEQTGDISVTLLYNGSGSPLGTGLSKVASWIFDKKEIEDHTLIPNIKKITGADIGSLKGITAKPLFNKSDSIKIRLTRMKSTASQQPAMSIELFLTPKFFRPSPTTAVRDLEVSGYKISSVLVNMETGETTRANLVDKNIDGEEFTFDEAKEEFNKRVDALKSNDFVDNTSSSYIPENANPQNYNFVLNTSKTTDQSSSIEEEGDEEITGLLATNKKHYKFAQPNYEGFYSGSVPEYALGFLGTSAVEASQIESMFGKSHEAINLVNRFNSSLLLNISFVFNFDKGGAYGVYLGALDTAIKTQALAKQLEQQGYEIKNVENRLIAFPKQGGEKSQEEIQKDIDTLYSSLQSKGGTAIGINMSAVLNAARMDAQESKGADPDMWQWIAMLHLGGTIVHEAVHAKGSHDEGPSEMAEQQFIQWALPIVNEQYRQTFVAQGKEQEFSPLVITNRQRHASSKGWYKTAQLAYYVPRAFIQPPLGSDLHGRFPSRLESGAELSSWSMIAQEGQDMPIEKRLSRQFMAPIPKDLDQANDSTEAQLRKYTRDRKKQDPHAHTTTLLSEGYDEDRGYSTIEGLLNEKRPSPIMIPLQKQASQMVKMADQTLQLTPFMAEEIAVDFENYEEHFDDDPSDPGMQKEKILYEKITSNNFNFTNEELIMIGQSLIDISDKDVFVYNARAKKQLFNVQLQLGMWKPITDEKARGYVRSGIGVKMSHFPKVDGVRYDFDDSWKNKFGHIPSEPVQIYPKPIMKSPDDLKTTGNKRGFTKTATLFGWMNNLSISDGSTIPGLGDRVMAWEDRDEDFSEEESWIKKQPRYNPQYDIRGFYYRWIEPRFQPQLFDDMTRDYSNTHPAKRFASDNSEISRILNVLTVAKNKIIKNDISATRFISTQDVMPFIDQIFSNKSFRINVFHFGNTDKGEDILAVWVSSPQISEETIERVERHFQDKALDEEDIDGIIEQLFGASGKKEKAANEIVNVVKGVCEENGIRNVYIVGGYPRDLALKTPSYLIENIDFIADDADLNLKLGTLVAERLGVQNVKMNEDVSFMYNDININFQGNFDSMEIKGGMMDNGIDITPLNMSLFNRDFTINMLAYNVMENKIEDISGMASKDINNKVIRTFFAPDYICKLNPLVILRALKYKIRYDFAIDSLLETAMIENAPLLFTKGYSKEKLIFARENVKKEGKNKAGQLFKEIGIEKIEEI